MKRLLFAGALFTGYWLFVRPWHLRWGATDNEVAMPLPGDRRVPDAPLASTRAITVNAPVEAVWPWLVQMGQDRAGFYSYTWLENIFGTRMRNAEKIVSEWQRLEVGDNVRLHPRVALDVVEVVQGRSFVLAEDWSFNLLPIDARATRFIVRGRGNYWFPDFRHAFLNFVYYRLIYEPAHFIMEQGMMRGLKKRAEGAYRRSTARL
jgi:hypothetical protein